MVLHLSSREKQVLLELAKNSRLSDRDLASKLKTSQPTITRIRSKLMKEKVIDRFLILPNLGQLGLFFQAVTFVRTSFPAVNKKMAQWAMEQPFVLFVGEGVGSQNHSLLLESLHSDFSEYNSFMRLFREKFGNQVVDVQHFLLDTKHISKFYHWHSVLENRLSKLNDDRLPRKSVHVMSRRERFGLALEKIPETVGKIPNPLKRQPPKIVSKEEGKEEKSLP